MLLLLIFHCTAYVIEGGDRWILRVCWPASQPNQNAELTMRVLCQNNRTVREEKITSSCGLCIHTAVYRNTHTHSKSLNTGLHNPAIPLLGMHSKKIKTCIYVQTCTFMFIEALITVAKEWKQAKCPLTMNELTKYNISML